MRIALDIDDTITAIPEFFAALSACIEKSGGRVIIVSSRTDNQEVRIHTVKELAEYGIVYSELYLLPDSEAAKTLYDVQDLNWYQKYLYGKVEICKNEKINVVYDDDPQVLMLFQRHAPEIQVFQVIKPEGNRWELI